MKKYKSEIQNVQVIESIICDKCKNEIKKENIFEFQECFHILHKTGFDSKWGDDNIIKCDLCQNCFYEMFKDIVTIKQNHYF